MWWSCVLYTMWTVTVFTEISRDEKQMEWVKDKRNGSLKYD